MISIAASLGMRRGEHAVPAGPSHVRHHPIHHRVVGRTVVQDVRPLVVAKVRRRADAPATSPNSCARAIANTEIPCDGVGVRGRRPQPDRLASSPPHCGPRSDRRLGMGGKRDESHVTDRSSTRAGRAGCARRAPAQQGGRVASASRAVRRSESTGHPNRHRSGPDLGRLGRSTDVQATQRLHVGGESTATAGPPDTPTPEHRQPRVAGVSHSVGRS